MIDKIILGGGCFWCIEAIFQRIKGVISVTSGYAGGDLENPSYKDVCSGKTNHVEVVEIIYDTDLITLEDLLFIFWRIHDPTTLNRQGNDIGTQYKSVIFYFNDNQKEIIIKSKNDTEKLKIWDTRILTEILPFKNFYKAEDYHQNYYNENTYQPYCSYVITPKINKLKKEFSKFIK
ncbi:MAG: peptide methionine sulfoxide reductase MsrA [Candidatus Sericytochromatia bacterium]|nr:MAG: peptide methionine sulfoxide reductase MsrA [Candidatus Sericytochromatia bacterium]